MSALKIEPTRSIVAEIRAVAARTDLGAERMHETIDAIMGGEVSQTQIAALLVALALKGETAYELAGAATAMRAHATPVRTVRKDAIDVCGTGGDCAGTFNISTAVAFVVAGAGVAVAKHGNRAMSSRCGSADVLEALGVRIDLDAGRCGQLLDEHGIAFMFAQAYHPAMRHVAPVRRELGVRTLFNLLGPLTNPAGVRRQIVGVAQPHAQPIVAHALGLLGSERTAVIHGGDGLDEATLAMPTRVIEWHGQGTTEYELSPEQAGLERAPTRALAGGDAGANAAMVRGVLDGDGGPRRDVVVLNAALALLIAGAAADIAQGAAAARRSIDSGAARAKLADLVRESQR
ncbi:MAG: anthranilate phosphoribosyltransferase [Candidatus Eremiobacteraeota bacterium]|nr:anthranilate phosphoribosyltransferase [Candidatus Eremiobacteraeota bacterium]